MSPLRKLRSAARLGGSDRRLVAEAIVALVSARVRSALPFRRLAARMGGMVAPHVPAPALGLDAEAERVVRKIRWAIGAVAPWMPFRALCLQQAIAARMMLTRRGIGSVLHLGVDTSTPTMTAHAWLEAGALKVTGYPVDPALIEVARFV